VHVVVEVWEVPLARLVRDWKGRSARRANEILKLRGTFWQVDYFDSVVRDEAHLKRAIRYAEQNPVKAAMARSARDWLWSSASLRDDYERLPPPSERGL
jgi:REP element-mobilizing transposase RayT